MPVRRFQLLSFEDIMLFRGDLLKEGGLLWLLCRHADLLFPDWLFVGWRGESSRGRPAWPARVLMGILLLRYSERGMPRVEALRRAGHDARWRAALRLPWYQKPPDDHTVRDFEAFLRQDHPAIRQPRILVVFEHWTRLAMEMGVANRQPRMVIDSTPMWCYGAVLDTVNLLGEGLRALGRRWSRARAVPLAEVALEWDLPLLLAKSTKGHFEGTDWSDKKAKSAVLTSLADSVNRCVALVMAALGDVRENKRVSLTRRCRTLLRVVTEDLEAGEDGGMRVVRRQTAKRLISFTDPEAQHFRKSDSQVCAGFKLHVLGDAVSGLILALSVTPGGQHDETQAHPLIARAKVLREDIKQVLGDSAYGRMPTRTAVLEGAGVTLLAPPPSAGREDQLGKKDFDIDFDLMRATCPGGVATADWKYTKNNGTPVPTFCWSVGSEEQCSCRDRCPAHRRNTTKAGRKLAPRRRLPLHAQERELRALRAAWTTPEVRREYRARSQGERLICEMTRRGARRACAWGRSSAELQAYCIAAVNNLMLMARAIAADSDRAAA